MCSTVNHQKSLYFAADYVVSIRRAAAIAQLNFMSTNLLDGPLLQRF
jgi:hypothetical protein